MTKTFTFKQEDANDEAFTVITTAKGFGSLEHAREWAACNAALISAQTGKFIYTASIVEVGVETPSFSLNCHPSYWSEDIKVVANPEKV